MYWKPPHKNKSATIEEIWKEWMFRMDGQLSVWDLMAGWEAQWWCNNATAKSEATCHKKLITLIKRLSGKPNWSNELALCFLKDQYPIPSLSVPHLRRTPEHSLSTCRSVMGMPWKRFFMIQTLTHHLIVLVYYDIRLSHSSHQHTIWEIHST